MPSGLHVVSGCTASSSSSYYLPKALIKRTEWEDELPIKEWALHSTDKTFGDGPESGVALDYVTTEFDCDIVQNRTIRRPQFRRIHGKGERRPIDAGGGPLGIRGVQLMNGDFIWSTGIIHAAMNGNGN